MDHKTILVVDDDLVERKALNTKLRACGYKVLLAEDGASAISAARSNRPDLILLDISFPPDVAHGGGVRWDGFLLLDWLRRLEETKHTPVIFISVSDPASFKSRALAAGAVNFFHKSFDIAELLAAIDQALDAPKSTVPQPKRRILFVDDEGDWRLIAGTCLADAGFEVMTAQDIAEALQRMEAVNLDGIVLDVNLAGQNGLLLLELLKQKHPGVPILIYTGLEHDSAAIQTMLTQGAARYLRKGSMGDLCATLKRHGELRMRKARNSTAWGGRDHVA